MEMRAFGPLISAQEARRRLLRAVVPVKGTEELPVEHASGRVAATTVRAPHPVPAFARATWDGYALRSGDTRNARPGSPVRLRIVGEVYAESAFPGRLGPSEAVAIATGGAVPSGADAVAIFEEVARRGPEIRVPTPVPRGDRIARPGADIARGTRIVGSGEELSVATVGALAACGLATVRVWRKPVVEVIPNGNELLVPGAPAQRGMIHESNNAVLSGVISAAGGIPRLNPPVADRPERIESALRKALGRSDLVLATGGSSVGERDHLPRVLPRVGRLLFHGIAVRPGKPTLAATRRGTLVIGLPGHPASCLSNMFWLVLPVLRRLAHRPGPGWTEEPAVLTEAVAGSTRGFSSVVPFELRDGRAFPTFKGSSAITSLRRANGFALFPPERSTLERGRRIRVCRLAPPIGPMAVARAANR
jgi:molybdenum cofactor synthesis domain-containing protein